MSNSQGLFKKSAYKMKSVLEMERVMVANNVYVPNGI